MARLSGSLLTYLRNAWSLVGGLGTANIHWSEDWYESKYPNMPQISITDLISPVLERYGTGGSMDFKYRPLYLINIWQQIPRGDVGTQMSQNVQDMRLETAKVFREGIDGAWGGSLGPFQVALPQDAGIPRHELDKVPRMLRFEITLITTRDNE